MIGQNQALQAAVGYYLSVKNQLKDKPNEELEQIIIKSAPKAERHSKILFSGIVGSLGSIILAAVATKIPYVKEYTDMLGYLGFGGIFTTLIYAYTFGINGLEHTYRRDAAKELLKKEN